MESKKRSIVKTAVWRSISLINGTLVTFLFLGDISISIGISVTVNIVAVILYYLHERVWNKIKWGQKIISKK